MFHNITKCSWLSAMTLDICMLSKTTRVWIIWSSTWIPSAMEPLSTNIRLQANMLMQLRSRIQYLLSKLMMDFHIAINHTLTGPVISPQDQLTRSTYVTQVDNTTLLHKSLLLQPSIKDQLILRSKWSLTKKTNSWTPLEYYSIMMLWLVQLNNMSVTIIN